MNVSPLLIDVAALALLGLMARVGWQRGTLLELLKLASLGAGYLGAALLFRPVGSYLVNTFQMSPLVAFPVAATAVMGLLTGGLRLATRTVEQRRAEARSTGHPPSVQDRAGGAAIGATFAAGIVVLVAWAAMGIQTLVKVGPDVGRSVSGRVASATMRRVTYIIARHQTGDQFTAGMLALVAGQPANGVVAMNTLLRNPHVQSLWSSQALRTAIARGDVQLLQHNADFQAMTRDTAFLAAAAQVGLGGMGGGGIMAQQLVTQVGPLMRTFESLGTDREFQRTLNDPAFRRLLDGGNVAALVGSPQFHQLASRVLERLRQAGAAAAPAPAAPTH